MKIIALGHRATAHPASARRTSAPARPSRRRGALTRTALSLLILGVTACGPSDELARVAKRMTAIESARPFTVPDQALLTHTGASFNLRDATAGRFAILFFGYTYCPDVCPIQMATTNAALAQLTDEERSGVLEIFVTVDPQRDTPERLADWIDAMRSPAVGLRGSTEEIERLLGAMGFVMPPMTSRQPIEGGGPDAYLVPHPTSLFLITPDGLGRFQYRYEGTTPAQIVADLRMLMELDWSESGRMAADGAAGETAGGATAEADPWAVVESSLGTTVAGPITIRGARIPENAASLSLALYAEVENRGPDDALVGIESDVAEVGLLHVVETRNGLASMRSTSEIPVPEGGTVALRSGQQHGMFSELLDVLRAGDTVDVEFIFASGARIVVQVPVVPLSDMIPADSARR